MNPEVEEYLLEEAEERRYLRKKLSGGSIEDIELFDLGGDEDGWSK